MSNMPPPPPGYSDAGQSTVEPKNGLGTASLVLGIISILAIITVVGGILFGLIGAVLGFIARRKFKKGEATNGGVALAGIITSLIGLLGSIALVVVTIAFLGDDFNNLVDCVADADGDSVAEAQCENDFGDDISGG